MFISGEGEAGQCYRLRQLRDAQWCGNMKRLQVFEDIQIQNTRVLGSVSTEERSAVVLKIETKTCRISYAKVRT